VIGDNNTIREGVTIHRGTVQDEGLTSIGSDNLFMAYAHIGHDCVVGNHIVMTNNAAISGHVHVGDWAILSGFAAVHQYVHLGAHCFVGPQPLFIMMFQLMSLSQVIRLNLAPLIEKVLSVEASLLSKFLLLTRPIKFYIAGDCSCQRL